MTVNRSGWLCCLLESVCEDYCEFIQRAEVPADQNLPRPPGRAG